MLNKVISVKADDTFAFDNVEFTFNKGIWSINGENGKGKSSLFFLLCQGFYNRNPKDTAIDDINNYITGKPSEIEIVWLNTDTGTTYKVNNSRKTGKIKVWEGDSEISQKTIQQNLKLIEEKLNCSYDNFLTQCFVDSTTTLDLVESANDAPRKAYVNKIIKTELLDAKLEVFKQKKKEVEGELTVSNSQLETLRASISPLQEEIEEDVALEQECSLKVDAVSRLLNTAKETRAVIFSKFQQAKQELENWDKAKEDRNKAKQLEQEIAEIILPKESKEDLEASKKEIRYELTLLRQDETTYKSEIDKCNKAIKNKTCPTCGHEIDVAPFVIELAELTISSKDVTDSIYHCESKLLPINTNISIYQQHETLTNELNKLKANNQAINIDIKGVTKQKEKLQQEGNDLNSEVTAKEIELNDAKDALKRVQEINQRSRTIREVNASIRISNAKLTTSIEKLQQDVNKLERRLEVIKKWITILGPKGYRVHKINKFLKQLNQAMKKYSDILSNGRIVSKFYVDEEGKIQFKVRDIDKALPFPCWSSGEKARVKLSCLFADLELREVVGGSCFNILYLDEIGATLDQEGKDNLFEVLAYLKNKDKCIYCISHTPLVNPVVFDGSFKFEKTDGISSIIEE